MRPRRRIFFFLLAKTQRRQEILFLTKIKQIFLWQRPDPPCPSRRIKGFSRKACLSPDRPHKAQINQRFFSPKISVKKVSRRFSWKIPQIYWVESGYFFSLSAAAEHGERIIFGRISINIYPLWGKKFNKKINGIWLSIRYKGLSISPGYNPPLPSS